MRAPSSVTLALAAATLAMVALVHADPWRQERAPAPMLSAQSVARRLFPELAEADLERATIELRTPAGTLRVAPDPDGLHRLWRDDAPLGFVDSEALAGLWSSLRMATTLRAVAPGSPPGPLRGEIAVVLEGREASVRIFGATSDGVGLHGVLPHEGEAAWVVEAELGAVLDQAPEGWLLRRLLPVEPAEATALVWDGLALARGQDGLWRVTDGAPHLLLAEQAVALRLGQALSAEFDPLLPRAEAAQHGPFAARHRVTDALGHVREVLSGGTCPGEPERVVIDRGPGLLGCVAAEALAAFPVADPDAGLVEPQLVPHAYGRVLAIELATANGPRRLRRFGGGWVIEAGGAMVEVSEPEVFRWYGALQAVAVELTAAAQGFTPQHRLTIETDSGQTLGLACGPAGAAGLACARDDGPPLRVIGALPELEFTRETFAERRLLSFVAGEVRGLELLPGPASDGVRQSVRLDLGVWRLDAPAHPDGVAVLDEVRLEAMLAALQSLRAEGWTPVPASAPLRTLRVERLRGGQGDAALTVELFAPANPADPQCVAHVPGQAQAARLEPATCAALHDDLLYNDPLRFWLAQARSAQLERADGGATAMLRREGDAWSIESGEAGLLGELPGWAAFRSAGLRSGEPRGATAIEAKIWRSGAAAVRVDLGPAIDGAPAWVRLAGQPWYYLAGSPSVNDAE
ncbi:hypothetical protein [Nannocystis sp.]|uniref:hypothetical protein n=1 Tax=Nannocystis sp. TaxID=1962667 RepID=UPI0025CFC4FD|nr:hypothetical protein [Nannocystis sp.]MBK7824235.1 hypothetical protein [Nannocystis sp.]